MFLVFDTETTGLPKIENAPLTDFDNWPRMVQLAWQIHDEKGRFVERTTTILFSLTALSSPSTPRWCTASPPNTP